MNIVELKEEFGSQITFWGGISTQKTLPYGSPADVEEESRFVRRIMSKGGGYIFSPAQELQTDVPWENVEALRRVAWED
jgi:uroporphyrinogen decarboxylase